MAWIEKRRRYRLRDELAGQRVTIFKDLGIWRDAALDILTDYHRAEAAGMKIEPGVTTVADIRTFLRARAEGRDSSHGVHPIPIEEMLDIFLAKHGPSLKGGISEKKNSAYYGYKYHLNVIKRAWPGRMSDDITKLDVRDLLSRYTRVGSKMKYLNIASKVFSAIADWNEEGILKPPIKIPPHNPAKKWRKEMKAGDKREYPDTRVLTHEEWAKFRPHLSARAKSICDLALGRFLRRSDIKKISHLSIKNGSIEGLQEKTGEKFSVPVLSVQPTKYNFTNFRRDFFNAQVAAGMNYPKEHPLHFSMRTLRRTGATWAYRKTKDLDGIRKMLGHRRITTTMRYLHVDPADLKLIANAVDTLIDGILGLNKKKSKEGL